MAEAKAPGKVLWMGGYSVLERPNIGYVTTIDAYVHANVDLVKDSDELCINVPDFNMEVRGTLNRETGRLTAERPKVLNLLMTTVEVALAYVAYKGVRLEGMHIETKNDDSFKYRLSDKNGSVSKSAMGSSSALTVSLTSAILASYNLDIWEDDAMHKLAQLSHNLATGKVGSGFDIAAAAYGSIIYSRYPASILSGFSQDFTSADVAALIKREWGYSIKKAKLPSIFKTTMANFVNNAAITTSLVGVVNEFKKRSPDTYQEIINEINKYAERASACMAKINGPDDSTNIDAFVENFEKSRMATKMLGELSGADIETEDQTKLIEESKKNGALVARLPGAGGKDSIVALSLDDKSAAQIRNFWPRNDKLEVIGVSMQNDGVTCINNNINRKGLKKAA